MDSRLLVIWVTLIQLGLCDVTQPSNGCPPLLSILNYTDICNSYFSFDFD